MTRVSSRGRSTVLRGSGARRRSRRINGQEPVVVPQTPPRQAPAAGSGPEMGDDNEPHNSDAPNPPSARARRRERRRRPSHYRAPSPSGDPSVQSHQTNSRKGLVPSDCDEPPNKRRKVEFTHQTSGDPAAELCAEIRPSASKECLQALLGISTLVRARHVVHSFKPKPFVPWPSSNAQIQTILGHKWPPPPPVVYRRVTLPTDDGLDRINLDVLEGVAGCNKRALIIHGLESSSTGVCSVRFASALAEAGYEVWAFNMRSCAEDDDAPRTLRLYHAGFYEDVRTTLLHLRRNDGYRMRTYLVGYSLGANIMCNFLRYAGTDAADTYGVAGAFGLCVPFDPAHCQRVIDNGWRQRIYSSRLALSIVNRFNAAVDNGADVSKLDVERIRAARTIGEVDDAYIAPVFGFDGKKGYYAAVDANKCLSHITVPTLLLNAINDPFFNHSVGHGLPTSGDIGDAPVRVLANAMGGHCGFLDYAGFTRSAPVYVARIATAFCEHVEQEMHDDDSESTLSA